MKVCRKILYLFLVSLVSISLLAGCQSNQSNSNSNDTNNTTKKSSNNESSNNEFKEYNVLSFSELKLDKKSKYDGDNYYSLKVKVTNNSNKIVRDIKPTFFVYDKNGDMIVSAEGEEIGSLESNKSLNIEATVEKDKDMDNIKINNYSYSVGKNYYTVDLISKYAEVYTD